MKVKKHGYVYILFNKPRGTLYTGVTSNLLVRVMQHKSGKIAGFTKRYGIHQLGYFEKFDSIVDAIECEKQIKAGTRVAKIKLVESMNPEWVDLLDQF